MFRKISNYICKRHKTLEEKLELSDTIQMIKDINIERLKKIKFRMSFFVIGTCTLKKANPNKAASFLESYFYKGYLKIQEDNYVWIKHEVFKDMLGKEKHYVDIICGNRENIVPAFTGNINYLLKQFNFHQEQKSRQYSGYNIGE